MRAENLAERLRGVKRQGEGYVALCPGHEDRKASLSFKDGEKAIVLQCFAGCGVDRIVDALQIRKSDLFFGSRDRQIIATYDYQDEQGQVLYQTVRYQPKDFRQRRPDGTGGWIWNLKDTRLVLYHLPEVLAATCVLVVEGEKDVESASLVGLPEGWAATCNPMGAGKWKPEYADTLAGKYIVIVPDADEPGLKHAERIALSLKEKAIGVNQVTLPEGLKDLSQWAAEGKTAEDLALLLEQAQEFAFMSPTRDKGLPESYFAPLAVDDFLDLGEADEAIDWILEDYLPAGGAVLMVARPKEGKTTFAYELAVKVAQGQPFLGRNCRQTGVLIVAVDEHQRDIRLRLRALGAEGVHTLFIAAGQLESVPDTLAAIERFVLEHDIGLVLVDTLGSFWRVQDENDAAGVTKAMKLLLGLARKTGTCVLLIHHARKAEGVFGTEIRGSNALFASVDVALVMKRTEIHSQRLLQAQSRYPETPSELVIELREAGYVALGDPATLNREAKREKIQAALTEELADSKTIAKRAKVSGRDATRLLPELFQAGKALREGKGRKGSPYRYRKNTIQATTFSIGPESNQDTNQNPMEPLGFDSGKGMGVA